MDNKALPSNEIMCVCDQKIPFDYHINHLNINCPACSREIMVDYVSLTNVERERAEKVVIDLLYMGTLKQFARDIYQNHLSQRAKELEENKQVHCLFGDKHFDITDFDGFYSYYKEYKRINKSFQPQNPDIDYVFKVTIGNELDYFIVNVFDDFDTCDVTYRKILYVEYFLRIMVDNVNWSLLDGKLNWVWLHKFAQPVERKPFFISKKELDNIRKLIGEDIYNVLLKISERQKTYSRISRTYSSMELLEHELDFHGMIDKKEEIMKVQEQTPACFIATATYGSCDHHTVVLLRNYKKNILEKHYLGNIIISVYYRIGPIMAKAVKGKIINNISKLILDLLANKLPKK